jgi:hypothetical protein
MCFLEPLCHGVRCNRAIVSPPFQIIDILAGMAKAVADTNEDNQGGFATDSTQVTGFSSMHDSGTGGVSRDLYSPNSWSES